jgi:hypothetical protein
MKAGVAGFVKRETETGDGRRETGDGRREREERWIKIWVIVVD